MAQNNLGAIKRIAIIGAGPSGLATVKYLLAEYSFSEITVYEQRDSVGGTWNYTPLSPTARKPVLLNGDAEERSSQIAVDVVTNRIRELNTPMYDGLESNLPHMLMQFSDKPFSEKTQLFPTRETVMGYLDDYASEIKPMIKFEHDVEYLKPLTVGSNVEWEILVKSPSGHRTEKFDAVIVANGHCASPLLPDIEGLETWCRELPDSIYHSVSYKNPESFENKRVLLVGGGPSGADIERQIAQVCAHPLLVARIEKSPYHTDEPNIRDHPTLKSLDVTKRTARFEDGNTESDIDAIIFCTGYAYSFPFLELVHPTIKQEGIRDLPLYKHIFHMQYPTLAFVEIPEMIVPFPLAECQAAVIARVWSGRLSLPSQAKMEDWREGVMRERGSGRKFHALMPPLDLEYMKEMYDRSEGADGRLSGAGDGGKGKLPRYWDERACWLRMNAAEMKKAFNARGDDRVKFCHYESLDFHFSSTD